MDSVVLLRVDPRRSPWQSCRKPRRRRHSWSWAAGSPVPPCSERCRGAAAAPYTPTRWHQPPLPAHTHTHTHTRSEHVRVSQSWFRLLHYFHLTWCILSPRLMQFTMMRILIYNIAVYTTFIRYIYIQIDLYSDRYFIDQGKVRHPVAHKTGWFF